MADKLYYDLLLTNEIIYNNSPPTIAYNDNRSIPLLKDTTDYLMSITRFSLASQTLPIWIPTILNVNTDPNKTIYSITMSYNDQYYQQYVEYVPQSNAQINDLDYYYVYNYQYVIFLFNQCMNDCLTGLLNAVGISDQINPPIFTLNLTNNTCNISFDTNYFGFNQTDMINVYFNYSTMSSFDTLPIFIMKSNINGCNYQLDLRQCDTNGVLYQELSTIPNWNPVSSIVFTSNQLPVIPSQIGQFNYIIDGVYNTGSSTANYLNIITDFIGDNLQFTPFLQYTSNGQYRYIALKPNCEIRNIDIQAFWLNKKTGQLNPLILSSGGSFSMKILFTKKETC